MTLIINNAADSRKLSEKNDPYGTNLDTILEMVQFKINQACESGVFFVSVSVHTNIRDAVILALIAQGYKVRQGHLPGETRIDIKW